MWYERGLRFRWSWLDHRKALRDQQTSLFDQGANHPPSRLVNCSPMDVQALHHRSKLSRERDACHPVLNSIRSMYQAGRRDPFPGNEAFFFFLGKFVASICARYLPCPGLEVSLTG